MKTSSILTTCAGIAAFALPAGHARAQLLQNLRSFGNSVSLIDPAPKPAESTYETDGPKELVTADFDLDGKPDLAASKVSGKVTVVFGLGGKDFLPARFLVPPAETGELRGIASGDFNGDGRPDIATAAPYSGRVVVFLSSAGRTFAAPVVIPAWRGVRNLIAADLDGDGDQDILAAGPEGTDQWTANAARIMPLYRNGAAFTAGAPLPLNGTAPWVEEFPRPVCSLAVLPPVTAGGAQRVVLTHAMSNVFWTTSWDTAAQATKVQQAGETLIPTQSLATGRILTQGGAMDLVTGARDDNQVLIRAGTAEGGFAGNVAQRLYLPGAPRALAIADVDNDGWNDLLVVLRNYDRVVTFRNESGTLKLTAEAPTGSSPRDLATADFNNDGRPDLVVCNRKSDNLSVLLTQATSAGFERLDSVYPLDGGVSALHLKDVNGDGRDDVILAHMQTSEIGVRMSGPGGTLGIPVFTKLTAPPLSLRPGDFDGDHKVDLIVVHNSDWAPGLSILKGRGDGTFAPPVFLPSDGGLFSIQLSDFDGDGVTDAAVGYYDCRLAIYKGLPNGTFALRRSGLFTYEARAMVTGDFDQDGDLDLAGASAMGSMVVVNNDGHLLEAPPPGTSHETVYTRTETQAGDKAGIKSMVILDANGDADPDVAINTAEGVFVYIGGPGLTFTPAPAPLPGTNSSTDLVRGDFDGDGIQDLATACRFLSCVAILKGQADLSYVPVAITPVPSADMIATGDVDGDGKADLAGAGEVLWIALSSHAPQSATGAPPSPRPPVDSVVINELMSSNLSIPLDETGDTPDFVEFFNGRATAVDLSGWTIRYQEVSVPGQPQQPVMTHQFPPGTTLPAGGRAIVICDEENLPGHASFKLSKNGGSLSLRNTTGAEVDTVTWANQDPDVSWGRFSDGAGTWVTKSPPDPNQPNYWNVSSGPDFKQVTVEPATIRVGTAPRINVKATDDAGIFTLTVVWKWLNAPSDTPASARTGQVGLFDDGIHGDGESLDGLFSSVMPRSFSAGAQIEFFVKATNLLDEEEISPGDPIFSLPGQEMANYSFSVPDATTFVPGLEVSEVQTHSAILDERGEPSDFVELRNTGTSTITLTGLALRDGLFSTTRTYNLTGTLTPGQYRLFYADSETGEGVNHLPFKLSNEGDSLWLVKFGTQGVPAILDRITPPAVDGGTDSWARLGPTGPFILLPPTPGAVNLPPGQLHGVMVPPTSPVGLPAFRVATGTPAGTTLTIEAMVPGGSWQSAGTMTGIGFESFLDFSVAPNSKSRFFRGRK